MPVLPPDNALDTRSQPSRRRSRSMEIVACRSAELTTANRS